MSRSVKSGDREMKTRGNSIISILLVAAFALFMLSACSGNNAANTESSSSENGAYPFEKGYKGTEQTAAVSQAELESIRTFSVEGLTYTIPCTVDEFLNTGWSTDEAYDYSSLDEGFDAMTRTMWGGVYLVRENGDFTSGKDCYNGESQIEFCLQNSTDDHIAWEEAEVCQIQVGDTEGDSVGEKNSFVTNKGLKIGMTVSECIDLYGDPSNVSWRDNGESLSSLSWRYESSNETGKTERCSITAHYNDENAVNGIEINVM